MTNNITNIIETTPGVMLVVNGNDLKKVVNEMFHECERRTKEALAAQREQPTMTRQQTADALNVTPSTLWRWAKDGYLVPVKIGSKVLYRASDVERMLTKVPKEA